ASVPSQHGSTQTPRKYPCGPPLSRARHVPTSRSGWATTQQRRRLASRLISWSVFRGDHLFANCTRDRMVHESSCDARDTCHVGGSSTAMNDVVPGVFHKVEVRGVVDPQLRNAGTD